MVNLVIPYLLHLYQLLELKRIISSRAHKKTAETHKHNHQ